MFTETIQHVVSPVLVYQEGLPLPDNSELRKLAFDVLNAAKYTFCVVASDLERETPRDTLEFAFQRALVSIKDDSRRSRYVVGARRLLSLDEGIRTLLFGRHGSIPPDQIREVTFERLVDQAPRLRINRNLLGLPPAEKKIFRETDKLQNTWGPMTAGPLLTGPLPTVPIQPLQPIESEADVPLPGFYRKLDFRVRWIKCEDETSEWSASDEIRIGGVSVDALGNTKKLGPSPEYEDFDTGDKEWFSTASPSFPGLFASFDRPKPKSGEWLYDTYFVTVALAEIDQGGFGAFLDELYDKTRVYILAAVAAFVFAGTLGVFPAGGPYLAAAVSSIAAWATDELIKWFIQTFEDDPFPPKTATITTPRGFGLPGLGDKVDETGLTTSERDLHFYGYGGHYSVHYHWKFHDWVNGTAPQ